MSRILMVAPEATSLARCGGLGDFVRGLFLALDRGGHDVRLFMPAYRTIPLDGALPHALEVPWRDGQRECRVLERTFPGTERPTYLVADEASYGRAGIYGDGLQDYPDNPERFGFLCRSALAWLLRLGWQPDVVHVHDWPAAAALVHMRTTYHRHPFFDGVAGVFTFQDLQFQGQFPAEAVERADLPAEAYHEDAMESWGWLNLLKAGTVFADFLTTVSPTYLREVQTLPDLGLSLERIFAQRHANSRGILKGVDTTLFDPEGKLVAVPFQSERMEGKGRCRELLLQSLGLAPRPRLPVLGVLSRFTVRRGIPILLQVLPRLLEEDVRVVIAGGGDADLVRQLQALASGHPGKMALTGYEDLHAVVRLYAACDLLVRPSLHEPCGLPPMEALRFGTLPVVRRVGGYVDSMVDAVDDPQHGYAFSYRHAGPESLEAALQRALTLWRNPEGWQRAVRNAMACNFSWDRVAVQYAEVYETAAAMRQIPVPARGVHQ